MTKHPPPSGASAKQLTPLTDVRSPCSDSLHCPQKDVRSRALRKCEAMLVHDLDVVEILDAMIVSDDVTLGSSSSAAALRDVVATLRSQEERTSLLLNHLRAGNERTFAAFMEALRERYRHIHAVLDSTIRQLADETDSDDSDDIAKDRASLTGDAIRRILRSGAARLQQEEPRLGDIKRRHSTSRRHRGEYAVPDSHGSSVDDLAGEEERGSGASGGAGRDGGECDRYIDCYVIATRGRLQRERWIKHSGVRTATRTLQSKDVLDSATSVAAQEREEDVSYMTVVTKDVVFRLVDRTLMTPDLLAIVSSECQQIYVRDEECLYSPAKHDSDSKTADSNTFSKSAKEIAINGKNTAKMKKSSKRREHEKLPSALAPPPPPLPPKPKNLPVVSSYPFAQSTPDSCDSPMLPPRTVNAESAVNGVEEEQQHLTMPCEQLAQVDDLRLQRLTLTESPPVPIRLPLNKAVPGRVKLQPPLPGAPAVSQNAETSPASTIIPDDCPMSNQNESESDSEEDDGHDDVNHDNDEDDEDAISLNYNVNLEDLEEDGEDPYESISPPASEKPAELPAEKSASIIGTCIDNTRETNLKQAENRLKQAETLELQQLSRAEVVSHDNDYLSYAAPTTVESSPTRNGATSTASNSVPVTNGIKDCEVSPATPTNAQTLPVNGGTSVGGRTSPTSDSGTTKAALNARDSGVDSIVSHGFSDSPNSGVGAADKDVFLSASLGDLEIHAAEGDDDKSSTDCSYYEDIELVEGFLSPSIYLDPRSSMHGTLPRYTGIGGEKSGTFLRQQQQLLPEFNFEMPPDRKVVSRGSLMLVVPQKAVPDKLVLPVPESHDLTEAVQDGDKAPSTETESAVLAYDKTGTMFYMPTSVLKRHGDPQEERWFYPIELTAREATLFLSNENQKGCFVVYRPAVHTPSVVYILSVCRGEGLVVHYHIVRNPGGDFMIDGHDHSFMTVCHLIDYFCRNQSRLATRLRRALSVARLPITPGCHYPRQHELSRGSVHLSGKIIADGQFGALCQGLYRGTTVSVKVLQKENGSAVEEDDFLEEALVMMNLKHDNIAQLVGVCCSVRPFYIVTEFFEKGSLKHCLEADIISCDNVDVLFDLCIQMVSALTYLESRRFVLHRDVRAVNFLLSDDMLVKLSNFERARAVVDDNYQVSSNSDDVLVRWAAPEVLRDGCYSTKSDVWALGVVFWEVFSRGTMPYGSLSDRQIIRTVVIEGVHLEKPAGCARDLFAMMRSCWRAHPDDRPSFATLSEKIRGKSSIYYATCPSAVRTGCASANLSLSTSSTVPKMFLPLPVRVKPSMSNHRMTAPAASGPGTVSTRVTHRSGVAGDTRRGNSLHVENGGGTHNSVEKRGSASSYGVEPFPTSSSDSLSVVSSMITLDGADKDLTRSDKIRKSLRKLIKKKSPSHASSRSQTKPS